MNRYLQVSFVVLLAITIAACDSLGPTPTATATLNTNTSVSDSFGKTADDFIDNLKAGVFTVCKIAEDDPTAVFEFNGSVVSPRAENNGDLDPIFLSDGECVDFWVPATPGATGNPDTVTVTELVPDGWMNDGITVYSLEEGVDDPIVMEEAGPTHSGPVLRGKTGCLLVYRNSKVPGGGEGCTPGAWKNRLKKIGAWDLTGYATGDLVNDVFNAPVVFDGVTLLEALSLQGGDSFDEKVEILLRAATAALLNAGHPGVDYNLTPAQVITQVNDAIATGNNTAVTDLATQLDDWNNQGCDITNG
ncbi:MAG: hypothetical protein HKN43_13790 [Rhodothermales bacterium]|nr:hypothetical protein [Rhodothermales bacterium]